MKQTQTPDLKTLAAQLSALLAGGTTAVPATSAPKAETPKGAGLVIPTPGQTVSITVQSAEPTNTGFRVVGLGASGTVYNVYAMVAGSWQAKKALKR